MPTTNPSVTRAIKTSTNLYTIDLVGISSTPNFIGDIYSFGPNTLLLVKGGVPLDPNTGDPIQPITSATGVISDVQGDPVTGPWTATITGMTSTAGLVTGDVIYATDGTGSLGNLFYPTIVVTSVLGATSITISARLLEGPPPLPTVIPTAGTITDIYNQTKNQAATIPTSLVGGGKIIISGVEGMPELATGGINGTNSYYASSGIANEQSFNLALDPEGTSVDSSTWAPAVPNTGQYNVFVVPNYIPVENTLTVVFENYSAVGTEIDLNFGTGQWELAADYTYSFSAIAYLTGVSYGDNVIPTYQWFNVTTQEYIGNPAPIGTLLTYGYTTTETTVVELRVMAPNGVSWTYPATLRDIAATIQVTSGFVA
jgi:hypothetical protein